MQVPGESRTYRVTNDTFDSSQWANWERDMVEKWGFTVDMLQAKRILTGIWADRNDFARVARELGTKPSSAMDERTWNGVGRMVVVISEEPKQELISPGDVVRPASSTYQRDNLYSATLLDRLSDGEANAPLMNAPGAGIACVRFLNGLVSIAGEKPDFFAESSRKAVEALQARAAAALNPVV